MQLRNDTEAVNATADVTKLVRIPNNLLGKVLDHGRASADAAHLLAIKLHQFDFPGGALNEGHCRREYGIGRRSFRAGIRLLKKTGALKRTQPNHRAYAVETVADPSHNFALIEEKVLQAPSSLVAFTLAVTLPPARCVRPTLPSASASVRAARRAVPSES